MLLQLFCHFARVECVNVYHQKREWRGCVFCKINAYVIALQSFDCIFKFTCVAVAIKWSFNFPSSNWRSTYHFTALANACHPNWIRVIRHWLLKITERQSLLLVTITKKKKNLLISMDDLHYLRLEIRHGLFTIMLLLE